uniref:Ribosome assembly protein 3 n=2 Tax=Peronospora matthiolae TaxID=2874970 RepID=A0AAV1V6P9_9STRA
MDDDGKRGARLAARYDRLIAALGSDGGVYARVDEAFSAAVDGAATSDEQRRQLLVTATATSVRCAELIAKSLETNETLEKLQKTMKRAYECSQEGDGSDEDEAMDSDEEGTEATTLLLQDLVAAGDAAADAASQAARLGVVRKTARASQDLLASAACHLQKHLASSDARLDGDVAGVVENEFRQLYMEEFSTAFGDELDTFRQEERFESKDVTYLISCIHAGGDVFTPLQKQLFVESVRTSRADDGQANVGDECKKLQ